MNNLETVVLAHIGEKDYADGVSLCIDDTQRVFVAFPDAMTPLYVVFLNYRWHSEYVGFADAMDCAAKLITHVESVYSLYPMLFE